MLVSDIKNTIGNYKLIKANDTYLFASWDTQHIDMLPLIEGEVNIQGAGMIVLGLDWWKITDDRSETLKQAGYEHYYITLEMIDELTVLLSRHWRMH